MKKRIDNLLSGMLDEVIPPVTIDHESFDLVTPEGEHIEESLTVSVPEGYKIRGNIVTTSIRIVAESDKFSGNSPKIVFGVDVAGLSAGDEVAGDLVLETNAGEFRIPVRVSICLPGSRMRAQGFSSLDEFASLALRNYDDAYRCFRTGMVRSVLTGDDAKYGSLYEGLMTNPVTAQRMEEFLVATGRKEQIVLTADRYSASFYYVTESRKESIVLRKNTWGSVFAEVSAEGDFIEIPVTTITEDDFIGNGYVLDYVLNSDAIGSGKKIGKIRIKSLNFDIEIDITASKGGEEPLKLKIANEKKWVQYTRLSLDRRLGRMDNGTWMRRVVPLLEAEEGEEEFALKTLLKAWVYSEAGKPAESVRMLRLLSGHDFSKESQDLRAAYIYLSDKAGLLTPGRIDVSAKIREFYQRNQESLILTMLTMESDPSLKRLPYEKLDLLRHLYDFGSKSPLLYAEAYDLIEADDRMVTRLTPFILDVLSFAVKEKVLSERLAVRTAYLSDNEKTFDNTVYRVLAGSYDLYPAKSILEAICKLIMKGDARDGKYFRWYSLAVGRSIQLIGLYENYIATIPENYQRMLPNNVRKYFAYETGISDSAKAFIYVNIIRFKEKDPVNYEIYRQRMEEFARESLREGRISNDHAVIYSEFIKSVDDAETAAQLAGILFAARLYSDDPDIRKVIVLHDEFEEEETYPVARGFAYIMRYTENARILFEDSRSRRVSSSVAYSVEPLMDVRTYLPMCLAFDIENKGFVLRSAMEAIAEGVSGENAGHLIRAVADPEFKYEWRMNIMGILVDRFLHFNEDPRLARFFDEMDPKLYLDADRGGIVEILVRRGRLEDAFEILTEFGTESVDPELCVRLAGRILEEKDDKEEEDILALALSAFRQGAFNERTLSYLVNYLDAPLEELELLRTKARAYFIDTAPLDRRILMKAMFLERKVGEGEEILRLLSSNRENKKLVQAAMVYFADRYFMHDEPMSDVCAKLISDKLDAEVDDGGPTSNIVERLALLKLYSAKKKMSVHEEAQADIILEECMKLGYRFRFFKDLPKQFRSQYRLDDKVIIETRAHPEDQVTLHYSLTTRDGAGDEMKLEPLSQVYRGVFSREFVLFYGELLTYFISVNHNGVESETPMRTVSMPIEDTTGRSKYQLINQMLIARNERKRDVLRKKMEEYLKAEQEVDRLFKIKEEM